MASLSFTGLGNALNLLRNGCISASAGQPLDLSAKLAGGKPLFIRRCFPSRRVQQVKIAMRRSKFQVFAGEQPTSLTTTNNATEGESAARAEESVLNAFQQLADSLTSLDADYLSKLPNDLKVDVADAGFAVGSGAATPECGEEVGNALLQLGKALEQADTAGAAAAARLLATEVGSLPPRSTLRAYLGKRLAAASRPLSSTGSYANGELLRVGQALKEAGALVRQGCEEGPREGAEFSATRTFKFGTLQVEVTPGKAFTGAGVAAVFGVLCWQLASGLQGISTDPNKFANENASSVAGSLQGVLLFTFYSCTLVSALSAVGLVLLGLQLNSSNRE